MIPEDYRHLVPPHLLAGLVDAGDAIQAACATLCRDPHPDRADALIERLRAAQHAVERLRRAMVAS